jgi:hypothetical protein
MSETKQWSWGLSIGLVLLCIATTARGQEAYKSDPLDPAFVMPDPTQFDETKREQKAELSNQQRAVKAARSAIESTIDDVFRGTTDFASVRAEFDRYFNGLAFPLMTQTDEATLEGLGRVRYELLRDIRGTANDSALRRHLTDELVLPFCTRVMADAEYHPAVRLNAVLLLGSLNRRDGQRNVEPSVPLDTALRALVTLASAQDTPGYLKAAAFAGILRHVGIDGQLAQSAMDPAVREQIINMAINLLDTTVPADGSPLTDEQYWLRRQCVQILGAFRVPGADGKILSALKRVLEDENSPLWISADAVEAIGNMRVNPSDQVDVSGVAKLIGAVVSRFLKADIQDIDNYIASIRENRSIARRSVEETSDAANAGAAPDESGAASGSLQGKGNAGDAGAALSQTTQAAAPVDVPNYKINDVRSRTKFIVFVARKALDGLPPRRRTEQKQPENLKALADAETAKMIDQLVAAMDKVMSETDLAPVAAATPTSQVVAAQGPPKLVTLDERLRKSLEVAISSLESVIEAGQGAQPAAQSALGGQ